MVGCQRDWSTKNLAFCCIVLELFVFGGIAVWQQMRLRFWCLRAHADSDDLCWTTLQKKETSASSNDGGEKKMRKFATFWTRTHRKRRA